VFIRRIEKAERSVALLALSSDLVVGMLDFHGFSQPQQTHAGTFGMSVAKEARGRGVGKELLRSLFAWAANNYIRRVELEVFSNNERAIRLYEWAGFVLEGRKVHSVEVEGEFLDMLLMAKLL
jgi:RimJ/RimL family protein N-acetyltransferase